MSAEQVSETALPTVLELPARQFAAAWLNVAQAAGDDDGQGSLYRAVAIEVHGNSVRLAATDGYMLLHTWVGYDADPEEPLQAEPDQQVVALDRDARMKALMTWLHRATKDDPDATVSVRIQPADELDHPVLDPSMNATVVIVETERERLTLDTWDGAWSNWKSTIRGFRALASAGMAWSPELLARFSKLKDTEGPVELQFGDRNAVAVNVRTTHFVDVRGLVMAIRGDD